MLDLQARIQLLEEYARATEHWKIEPHDSKERRAWIHRLFPSGETITQSGQPISSTQP